MSGTDDEQEVIAELASQSVELGPLFRFREWQAAVNSTHSTLEREVDA